MTEYGGVPAGYSDRLYNEDLAPARERRWGSYSIFALWMSDVHNLGNYAFAAGLFVIGLSAWQVLVSLLVGFTIIYVEMKRMGYAGQRTGVPFPVFSRLSFGVWGANIPALIRAIIAIAWYGIQTYLASVAVNVLLLELAPGLAVEGVKDVRRSEGAPLEDQDLEESSEAGEGP